MPTLMITTEVRKPHPNFPGWIPRAKGRCNSQCYDAKSAVCYCVCGGVNHGAGLQKAIENTKNLKAHGMADVVFNDKVIETKVEPKAKTLRDAKGRFIKK